MQHLQLLQYAPPVPYWTTRYAEVLQMMPI